MKQPTTEAERFERLPATLDDDVDDDDRPDGEPGGPGQSLALRDLPANVKVFEVAFEEEETRPFALLVTNKTKGREELHQFEAVGDAGAGGMLAVSSLVRYDARGRQLVDLNAMLVFFERVLVEEDFDRLKDLIDRRDITIKMEKLSEVFNWLMEEYTGRPIQPSSDFAGSRRSGGRSSRAKRR